MATAYSRHGISLADENAKLRALVHTMGKDNMPASPPATEKSLSEPSSPCPSSDSLPFTSIAGWDALSPLNLGLSSLASEGDSAIQIVVALFQQQMAAQTAAQDQLLSQLGELRASHANLQAATSDVNDELTILRNTADQLADQVEQERKRREAAEAEKEAEAEKVAKLRQTMEESRRAIMRLQEEAANKRNNDSRRGSLPTISQSVASDNRRSSMQLSRRVSLVSPDRRRGSESGVGLGLEGVMMEASTLAGNRRSSVAAIGTRSRLSSAVDEEARSGLKNMVLASDKESISPDENDFGSRNMATRASLISTAIKEDEHGVPPIRRASIRSSYRTSVDLGSFKPPLTRPPSRSSLPDIRVAEDASEVALLKAQLAAMQNRLNLAQEAKEASDTCLAALKDFIALPKLSPSVSSAMKLPPMPTDDIPDEEVAPVSRRASMWRLPGFAVTAAPAEPARASPSRSQSLAVASTSRTDDSSTLTAFSGWSVRRRASANSMKEKRASLSAPTEDLPLPSTFDGFSFQSRARNPALDDSPASPGRGPPSISSSESSSPPWTMKVQC